MSRLGIFSWFGYQFPLTDRLRMIHAAGFDATSLWLGGEEPLVTVGRADDMPRLAADAGLVVDNAHAPFTECNLLWSESAQDRAALNTQYLDNLVFCSRHAIPILVIHLTRGNTPPPPIQAGLSLLHDLVQVAEDCSVQIAIENTRRPDYLDLVLAANASPALGLCYDSSHDFLYGQPPASVLRTWGHRLLTTHFSDNNGTNDDHWLPGTGRIDWDRVYDCFPAATYTGTILLEVFPQAANTMSGESFLAATREQAGLLQARLSSLQGLKAVRATYSPFGPVNNSEISK